MPKQDPKPPEALSVADLIMLLQTFPSHLPVTGYTAHENTGFVTKESVRLYNNVETHELWYNGKYFSGFYVDIVGRL